MPHNILRERNSGVCGDQRTSLENRPLRCTYFRILREGDVNYAVLLQSALVALLRNKMRSVLTVLGITIGIAAVICVVAIGKAGQAQVEQQLNNLGDNFVWIEAGGRAVNGVRTGTHGTKTLTYADAVAVKNQISLIKNVSPNVDGPIQVIYGNQNWFTRFHGV